MLSDIINMRDAISALNMVTSNHDFESVLYSVRNLLKDLNVDAQGLKELEQRAYYPTNEYSDKENLANLDTARKRVIKYLEQFMNSPSKDDQLLKILDNFYLFLESLWERTPHKSSGIQKEHLEKLKIQNEYDVQYLLYAYLKPLYPMERTEVNEDTGYGTVRADIFLDSAHIIEVKCTRRNMNLKKLTEEIEADMVHYRAGYIYFFIYDKEKLIENPHLFKNTYENKVEGKQIHITIHQPKIL